MNTAVITKITKETIVKTGERFLDVEIELRGAPTRKAKKGEVLEVIRWGYPLGTSEKEIKGDLKKLLVTRAEEGKQTEANAELEAEDAQADKTINSIDGLEITASLP